jgi:hypothetical protein
MYCWDTNYSVFTKLRFYLVFWFCLVVAFRTEVETCRVWNLHSNICGWRHSLIILYLYFVYFHHNRVAVLNQLRCLVCAKVCHNGCSVQFVWVISPGAVQLRKTCNCVIKRCTDENPAWDSNRRTPEHKWEIFILSPCMLLSVFIKTNSCTTKNTR